jgi:hypothetical protein
MTQETKEMEKPSLSKWQIQQEIRQICSGGNKKAINTWLQNHFDFITQKEERLGLVEHCATFNKTVALEHLISIGLLDKDIDKSNILIKASFHGSTKTVLALLKLGFDPKLTLADGSNALTNAAKMGHYSTTKILLKAGADPNCHTNNELIMAAINKKNETTTLILSHYPKEILEQIATETLKPAQESKLDSLSKVSPRVKKDADALIKIIATAIVKNKMDDKVQKYIKEKQNIIEM